jgi:hypothetical protein
MTPSLPEGIWRDSVSINLTVLTYVSPRTSRTSINHPTIFQTTPLMASSHHGFMSLHDSCNPHPPTSYQRAGPSSRPSAQSVHGPNTFDEAFEHFMFSDEERRKIAYDYFYASPTNLQQVPATLPCPSYSPPHGDPTRPIYHIHNQTLFPNQAVVATHQGTAHYYRSSRRSFSTGVQLTTRRKSQIIQHPITDCIRLPCLTIMPSTPPITPIPPLHLALLRILKHISTL